jgi:hypothetical protein
MPLTPSDATKADSATTGRVFFLGPLQETLLGNPLLDIKKGKRFWSVHYFYIEKRIS